MRCQCSKSHQLAQRVCAQQEHSSMQVGFQQAMACQLALGSKGRCGSEKAACSSTCHLPVPWWNKEIHLFCSSASSEVVWFCFVFFYYSKYDLIMKVVICNSNIYTESSFSYVFLHKVIFKSKCRFHFIQLWSWSFWHFIFSCHAFNYEKKVSLIILPFFAYFLSSLSFTSIGKLRKEMETIGDSCECAILSQAEKQS